MKKQFLTKRKKKKKRWGALILPDVRNFFFPEKKKKIEKLKNQALYSTYISMQAAFNLPQLICIQESLVPLKPIRNIKLIQILDTESVTICRSEGLQAWGTKFYKIYKNTFFSYVKSHLKLSPCAFDVVLVVIHSKSHKYESILVLLFIQLLNFDFCLPQVILRNCTLVCSSLYLCNKNPRWNSGMHLTAHHCNLPP